MENVSNFGILADYRYTPCSMSTSGRPLTRRACNECRRKKTRCDMRHPKCTLCLNVGSVCTYRGQHRQRIRRRSTTARRSSIDTMESAENGVNTNNTPSSSGGVVLLDDIDLILYNISHIDDQAGFLEPMGSFTPCGAVPSPLSQGYWPTGIPTSPIGTEINNGNPFSVSTELAEELVELYFEKVQGICPLFMREKFQNDYDDGQICTSSPVDQFVLNGMFALSARYSSSSKLAGLDPYCRDRQFVKRATELWEFIQKDWGHSVRTLQCLQGLILLTFSHLQSGPSETAWNLTGSCVRLAYDLDLHTIDATGSDTTDDRHVFGSDWELLEEKRRAWWTIWEMDTFSSSISSRPFGIDSRVVQVLLPVSDGDWAKKSPTPSASLGCGREMPWRGIVSSSNKCERAWFLVCLAVLRRTVDSVLSGASIQELQAVEDTIGCAFLALPSSFHDLPSSKAIWQSNIVAYNWMACSLIALNWARSRINIELHERLRRTVDLRSSIEGPKPVQICRSTIIDVYHLTRLFPPQALSVCSPLIFCAVVGLETVHVPRNDLRLPEVELFSLYGEHTKLVLGSVGRHWSIGRALLEVIESIKTITKHRARIDSRAAGRRFVPQWRALLQHV